MSSNSIAERLARVRQDIDSTPRPFGQKVTLIAVSKFQPISAIVEAYSAGARDFGENYAQELVQKAQTLQGDCPEARWHFIGRLQKNKINALLPWTHTFHTIADAATAEALVKRAPRDAGEVKPTQAFIQLNLADEEQKGGLTPAAFLAAIETIRGIFSTSLIALAGVMTIGPEGVDQTPYFNQLRALRDQALPGGGLSMGMSADYALAISLGATHVRVGSAIFGPRPARQSGTTPMETE